MSECEESFDCSASKLSAVRRPWTAEEDSTLIAAVNQYGSSRGPGSAWSVISKSVGGHRTNKDCRKRWFHSLDPNLRKGKWSREEDEKLKKLYGEMGPQWKEIALKIPGRKDDQVSKRWRDVLDPKLTPKVPWASLEDALLLQLFEAHGPKWTIIADHLPGRSPLACRNRSRKYLKTASKHRDQDPQDSDPSPGDLVQSSAADDSDSSTSVDMFLNWPFPDIPDESHSAPNALQFDYNIYHPPVTTESVLSGGTGIADNSHLGNTQEPFDIGSGDIKHSDQLGTEAISQWIASLSTDLSTVKPSNISEPVAHSQYDNQQMQPIQVSNNHPQPAVSDIWALLLALDSGQEFVNVDAGLLRGLLSDATHSSLRILGDMASHDNVGSTSATHYGPDQT
ncbi:hypothetical protein V865_005102 [Kwoniella europaea PYCC6329]|uniref:Uncharacterized protein n=1 Tax=Kwoniella europaea PYCC6329 TaxID=1423913 RepID=A0AAX4KNA7_9TREE